jgi:diacylglycerol kinase (ATP)
MRRLLHAATNTWQGLRAAARTEQAFRQELLVLVIALPTAFWVAQENWKRLILIGALVLLLITELLNTAIEKLADRISRESDVLIGEVKDMSSAAVGLAILLAALAWFLAFAEWAGLL